MIGNLGRMNVLITATDQASDDIEGVQNKMRGASQTARKLGTGMMVAGAAGVAAAGKSLQEFSKFEDQMVEVQKVTGRSDQEMSSLSQRLQKMSAGPLPASASELGKIAAQAGSVGIRGTENIANFTESVQKMATATRLSSQESAEQIAKISNAFDIPMNQAENLGSSINALTNQTASWADEITQGVRRAAGAASSLGISAQETSGIIATLVDNGMSARRAGTRMRRVFTQMSSKADQMSSVMDTSTSKLRKNIQKDAVGTLQNYIKAAKDTGNAQQEFSDTFGSAGKAALDMLSDVDQLKGNIDLAGDAFKENKSLQGEFESALGSLSNQAQNTKEKFDSFIISIGRSLAPTIKSTVLPVFNKLGNFLNNLDKETKSLIGGIAGLGGIALVVTGAAAVLGSALAAVTAPMIGIGLAVAGLIGGFVAFQKNMFGMRDAIMKMFKTAKPLINGLFDLFKFFIGDTIKGFGRLTKFFGIFVEKIVQPIYEILQPAIKNIGTAVILAIHTAGKVLKSGRELFGDFVKGVTGFFDSLVDGIVEGINFALEKVIEFINGLIEKANKASEALGMDKVAGKLETVTLGDMTDKLGGAVEEQRDKQDQMRLDIAKAVGGDEAQKQVKAFQDMVEMGVDNIDDMGRAIQDQGQNIMDTGDSVMESEFDVGDIQKALSKKKTGKQGTKTKAKNESKKQTKELKKLRKQLTGEGSGQGDKKIEIKQANIKGNNMEQIQKQILQNANRKGVS